MTTSTAATSAPADGTAEAVARATGARRYLTFTLGGEVYALDINEVTEIIEFRSLTTVPMMPEFIRGVINLRGRVLPVVDLAARFGHGTTAVARRTSIIVVEIAGQPADGDEGVLGNGQDIGIMVDTVNKVVHLADDDIEPPPAFGSGIRADFIAGMAKLDGEFIVVLDITRVLCLGDLALPVAAGTLGVDPADAGPSVRS